MQINQQTRSTATPSPNRGKGALREVNINDVIGALLDLCEALDVNSSGVETLVKSLGKTRRSLPRNSRSAAVGELLAAWHQTAEYLDKSGNPLPLTLNGVKSFRKLSKKSVPAVEPDLLLRELQRAGAVEIDAEGLIHARMRSLHVYKDKSLAVQHTLSSLLGFIRTLHHNLSSEASNSDQLFHRVAWNGKFDSAHLPELKIRIRRRGQLFLEGFDNWMMRKAKAANPRKARRVSIRKQVYVGVYLSVDDT